MASSDTTSLTVCWLYRKWHEVCNRGFYEMKRPHNARNSATMWVFWNCVKWQILGIWNGNILKFDTPSKCEFAAFNSYKIQCGTALYRSVLYSVYWHNLWCICVHVTCKECLNELLNPSVIFFNSFWDLFKYHTSDIFVCMQVFVVFFLICSCQVGEGFISMGYNLKNWK